MSVEIRVSRHERNENYILGKSKMYDIIEADLDILLQKQKGEAIFFRDCLSAVAFLMNHPFKSDWGVYEMFDFFFYIMAVNPDSNVSYKIIDDKTVVALFKPKKILKVIEIIVKSNEIFKEVNASQNEIDLYFEFQNLLKEAIKNDELILIMY